MNYSAEFAPQVLQGVRTFGPKWFTRTRTSDLQPNLTDSLLKQRCATASFPGQTFLGTTAIWSNFWCALHLAKRQTHLNWGLKISGPLVQKGTKHLKLQSTPELDPMGTLQTPPGVVEISAKPQLSSFINYLTRSVPMSAKLQPFDGSRPVRRFEKRFCKFPRVSVGPPLIDQQGLVHVCTRHGDSHNACNCCKTYPGSVVPVVPGFVENSNTTMKKHRWRRQTFGTGSPS